MTILLVLVARLSAACMFYSFSFAQAFSDKELKAKIVLSEGHAVKDDI
jgi:hypothetical protein